MEYNTQRIKLKISDYGRNVYKYIQYAKTIEDRKLRNQAAAAIVDMMAQVNPEMKDLDDYRSKLWTHLMVLADWQLDVDIPVNISKDHAISFHPKRLGYKSGPIRYRHYGRLMENMIRQTAQLPEGEERDNLTAEVVHAMKGSYMQWNRESVDNKVVLAQLSELSEGKVSPKEDFQFIENKNYRPIDNPDHKSNKKKKKKK